MLSSAKKSALIKQAISVYEAYELDELPPGLKRNSLDYYYLSLYPSLKAMKALDTDALPVGPASIQNVYVHIPFCSGVCEFCSYFLAPVSPKKLSAIESYLELVKKELLFHQQNHNLAISYIYFGGGSPSLIPVPALQNFLQFLSDRKLLSQNHLGTLELHPELFDDLAAAQKFLAVLKQYGLNRVSIGYQVSDEQILKNTNRRHNTAFMAEAMKLLRANNMVVNIDLMYGLAGQTLASWETTLREAVNFEPDSISTYFLFVDKGTILYKKVARGAVSLPSHRHIQTQHLVAQLFLESQGFYELPNDFFARLEGDNPQFKQEGLPSESFTLPTGAGAYGFYNNTQLCNEFDLKGYRDKVLAGESPLWRGYQLKAAESFHRDIMFSFKNSPFVDCRLFVEMYNQDPLTYFPEIFEHLFFYDLLVETGQKIILTPKGRLCVEEISNLFRCPHITETEDFSSTQDRNKLEKHNYSPSYPIRKA